MREPKGKITERELHPSLLEQLKSKTNDNIYAYYGSLTIDRPVNSVEIPISKFNGSTDILLVHKNGTYLKEDFDYIFDMNKTHIVRPDESKWNNHPGQISKFEFIALKNIKKYTKLSEIVIKDHTITLDKLDKSISRGLIPKGGHKGSYLVKKSNSDYDYEWLDFTNVNIILSNAMNLPLDSVMAKIVDSFSKEERNIVINNGVININDLPSGDYELIIFSNKSFKPEKDSYPFTVISNTQTQVQVNMLEKEHTLQLEIRSDVDITDPTIKINNIYSGESYTFDLEGKGTVISKIISLPSGTYEAVIVDDGNGLKQLTDVNFTLDYRHSVGSVVVTVLNRWRVCNLDLLFRPVVDMDTNTFIPLYKENEINLLNSFTLNKTNIADEYIINIEVLNLHTGESIFKRILVPKTGLSKRIPLYLENNVSYRIRTRLENGDFEIKGSLFEIPESTDNVDLNVEIFEHVSLLRFSPDLDKRFMFNLNTKKSTHRYYDITIVQSDDEYFTKEKTSVYKKFYNIKADSIIKVEAGKYYKIQINPDDTLQTYLSNEIFTPTLKLEVGQSASGSEKIINVNTPYTPIIEYGFRIDPSNSDPNECVHYICDCKDYIPIRNINENIDLGSWDNTFIINSATPVILENGRVVKELDKSNQNGVFNNLVLNEDFKGDFMVRFEKCYYYFKEELSGVIEFRICTIKKSPEYNAFAFTDFEGKEKNYMYYGMYEASFDSEFLRSLPGKDIEVNASIQALYNSVASKGIGYSLEDYSKRLYVICLHTLLSRSLDSQFSFGLGNVDSLKPNKTGITDSFPMFAGDNKAVKTFYIENLWGNTENWLQGLIYTNCNFRYRQHGPYSTNINEYYFADLTINPSDTQNPSNHIIKKCAANSFGILPQITDGNVNYYNDRGYISTNFPVPTVGGGYNDESNAGIWNINVFYKWTDANAKVGGRIVYV